MPDEIELQAKSDRDLLVMTVMQGNETVRHLELINGTLKDHEERLGIIEIVTGRSKADKAINLSKKQAAGLSGGALLLGSIIAGIILELPKALGWW